MHSEIAHRKLVDLRHTQQPLHLVANGLRDAQHLGAREAHCPRAPLALLRLGEGILQLRDDVELAEQGRLKPARHSHEMAERVESAHLETLALCKSVEPRQPPQRCRHKRIVRRHRHYLHAAACVENEELAHSAHAPHQRAQLGTLLRRQMVRRALAARQHCVAGAYHQKLQIAALAEGALDLLLRVARRRAALPARGYGHRQLADARDCGRGEVAVAPVHVGAAARHARKARLVENGAVYVLVVGTGEHHQLSCHVARRKCAPLPRDAPFLRKRLQLVNRLGAHKLHLRAGVQEALRLAKAHAPSAHNEGFASVDYEVQRNRVPLWTPLPMHPSPFRRCFRSGLGSAPQRTTRSS